MKLPVAPESADLITQSPLPLSGAENFASLHLPVNRFASPAISATPVQVSSLTAHAVDAALAIGAVALAAYIVFVGIRFIIQGPRDKLAS